VGARLAVSVVIPCLNEARSIEICVKKALTAMCEAGIHGEVVVVDNGSTDGSPALARAAGARVVLAERKGYGNALRVGIDAAEGDFIVMGDADDSYDFGEVPRFVEQWRAGHDVVMGNRFKGEIKPGAMPWSHRMIGNPVLSRVLRLLFRAPVGDVHCGLRGFTKDVYRRMELRTTGMEFASEFVIKATLIEARITEVPVTLWPDKRGRPPHLRSIPDGWRHLRFMLLFSPTWLFIAPGAVLATIGGALLVWLLPGPRTIGSVTLDVHTMVFAMVFVLVGAQIMAIGLFAWVFSYSERFRGANHSMQRALSSMSLEKGLALGATLTLLGVGGAGYELWRWGQAGFGPFSGLRPVTFWATVLFLGVLTIFSSCFLSMLGISRGTYIGDYEALDES
jgi:glycosyltransferase involved in cell wall biosynthesis